MTTGQIVIICVLSAVLAMLVFFSFQVKRKWGKEEPIKKELSERPKVEKVEKFLMQKELKFLFILSKCLPKGFISLPKISVQSLTLPVGNKDDWEMMEGKTIDYVVFEEKTMKSVLAVDLFESTYGNESLEESEKDVVAVLKEISLPIIKIELKIEYDLNEISAILSSALLSNQDKPEEKETDQKAETN